MQSKKGTGRGWRGDREGHARAGRAGGRATSMEYGSTFYSQISKSRKNRGKKKDEEVEANVPLKDQESDLSDDDWM